MHSLLEIDRPAVEDVERLPADLEGLSVQAAVCPPADIEHLSAEDIEHSIVGDAVWTATGHERPVFLDEHGRRRRWVWLAGAMAGGASAFWLGALVAGSIGFSTMPAMRSDARLLASSSHAAARLPASAHRRAVPIRHSPPSPGGGTELAVSRTLLAAR